jgi:hypothetical protein
MAHFFGTDRRSFITCSLSSMESTTCNDDPGAVFRSYTSFSGAAAENALARIYSGIHFRQDVEVGLVQGRRVADIVIRQVLRRAARSGTTHRAAAVPRPPHGRARHDRARTAYSRSTMALANSEHLTSVASSIMRAKS